MIRIAAPRVLACLCAATAACLGLPVAALASTATVTARPVRAYVPAGTEIQGTPSPAGAPALKPGQYQDSLRAEDPKHYTITLADGVTPYLAATVIRPHGVVTAAGQAADDYEAFNDYVEIGIGTASGTDCGSFKTGRTQDRSVGPSTAVVRPGRVGGQWTGMYSGPDESSCGRPGKYVVSVGRTQNSERIPNAELPVEIVFIAEPPLAEDVTALPPQQPVITSSLSPDITAAAKAVSGGGSYGTAAELPKSGGYTDNIRPGETLYYRIRLGTGQRVGYTLRFHGQKSLDESLSVFAYVATPFRELADESNDVGGYSSSSDETLTGQTAAPIGYRNRDSDADAVQSLRLTGYYYLVVNMDNSRDPAEAEVPINIAVQVAGKATDAPKYRKVDGTSNLDDLGLPGQESPGLSLRKVAYLAAGGLALTVALLVLLVPFLRRRQT